MRIQQLQQYPLGEKGLKAMKIAALYGVPILIKDVTHLNINSLIEDNWMTILYPLSTLTKEIEVYGERFVPIERIEGVNSSFGFDGKNIFEMRGDEGGYWTCRVVHTTYGSLPYWIIQLLQSWFINYQGIESVNPFDLETNPYK